MTPEQRVMQLGYAEEFLDNGDAKIYVWRSEVAAAIREAVAEALAHHHCDSCDGSAPSCWKDKREAS